MTVDLDALTIAGSPTPSIVEAEPLAQPAPLPTPAPISVPPPSTPTPTPTPAVPQEPEDTRQAWVCVTQMGPRTVISDEVCPLFRSDSHLHNIPVACPRCGSVSVRKAFPEEK